MCIRDRAQPTRPPLMNTGSLPDSHSSVIGVRTTGLRKATSSRSHCDVSSHSVVVVRGQVAPDDQLAGLGKFVRRRLGAFRGQRDLARGGAVFGMCLLYTSDAADDLLCVDLGGRRIIK